MSCWKLGAFCQLLKAKEKREALKGIPGRSFLYDVFTVHWTVFAHSDYNILPLHNYLMV